MSEDDRTKKGKYTENQLTETGKLSLKMGLSLQTYLENFLAYVKYGINYILNVIT